jgi:hypothetical protein
MLQQFNSPIKKPPSLTFVRDLEEYDGPILSEYSNNSKRYLEKWCSRDKATNIMRTLVVRTEQRAIAEYLDERISMLELLTTSSDDCGFILDKKECDESIVASFLVSLSDLPSKYLPSPTAMHNKALRPQWDMVPHSFLIGSNWNANKVAVAERQYMEVFGFSFFTQPGKKRQIPAETLTYHFDGGFPIVHAFNKLRASIPKDDRAKSVGVSANSPGVFTIEAPAESAEHLEAALRAVEGSAKSYAHVYAWSRLKPTAFEKINPISDVPALQKLCNNLNVDCDILLPPGSGWNKKAILYAGKLIAAYYRRLRFFLHPTADLEFIGVKLNAEAGNMPEELDPDIE